MTSSCSGRRPNTATGQSPVAHVQQPRVEEAKRRLERTGALIDEISWTVGYEDPAFFRHLFKRARRIKNAISRFLGGKRRARGRSRNEW